MADSSKHNLINPRRRGRGRARARGRERTSQDIELATVPFESQLQGHGRNIQYLATASTATEPRPGQRDVAMKDEVNGKPTVATPEQGTMWQLHIIM